MTARIEAQNKNALMFFMKASPSGKFVVFDY
jgi:hypothetical protein